MSSQKITSMDMDYNSYDYSIAFIVDQDNYNILYSSSARTLICTVTVKQRQSLSRKTICKEYIPQGKSKVIILNLYILLHYPLNLPPLARV